MLGAATSGTRRLEDAEILSRLEPVFGHVEGGRNLQASNMALIAQFLANAKNSPAPRSAIPTEYTLFAPTNMAFYAMPLEYWYAIFSSEDFLYDLILTHVYDGGAVEFENLVCTGSLVMVSGETTYTTCQGESSKFQAGAGNVAGSLPEIIFEDEDTSNGVIHTIDQVILPAESASPSMMPSASSMPSAEPSSEPSSEPSAEPSSPPTFAFG